MAEVSVRIPEPRVVLAAGRTDERIVRESRRLVAAVPEKQQRRERELGGLGSRVDVERSAIFGNGFVASFPRPGGNVTGFTISEPTMGGKWLELLKEIAPTVTRVFVPFNSATLSGLPSAEYYLGSLKATAALLGVNPSAAFIRDISELESAVAAHARAPLGGLVIVPEAYTTAHSLEVTSLAARYRLPTVYALRHFAEIGGLLSYGNEVLDNFRRAAIYADRILKGAKPSELPVQAPESFELVINLKTAKALGLTVPPALLAQADSVIE